MKQEFKMTQEEMDFILEINKTTSNTVMIIGNVDMSHNKTDAINNYWRTLGEKYGFDWQTVEGSSKGALFFLVTPALTKLEINLKLLDEKRNHLRESEERIIVLKKEIESLEQTVQIQNPHVK